MNPHTGSLIAHPRAKYIFDFLFRNNIKGYIKIEGDAPAKLIPMVTSVILYDNILITGYNSQAQRSIIRNEEVLKEINDSIIIYNIDNIYEALYKSDHSKLIFIEIIHGRLKMNHKYYNIEYYET